MDANAIYMSPLKATGDRERRPERERRREGEREYMLVSRAHNSHRERVRESRIGYAHVQSQGEG